MQALILILVILTFTSTLYGMENCKFSYLDRIDVKVILSNDVLKIVDSIDRQICQFVPGEKTQGYAREVVTIEQHYSTIGVCRLGKDIVKRISLQSEAELNPKRTKQFVTYPQRSLQSCKIIK